MCIISPKAQKNAECFEMLQWIWKCEIILIIFSTSKICVAWVKEHKQRYIVRWTFKSHYKYDESNELRSEHFVALPNFIKMTIMLMTRWRRQWFFDFFCSVKMFPFRLHFWNMNVVRAFNRSALHNDLQWFKAEALHSILSTDLSAAVLWGGDGCAAFHLILCGTVAIARFNHIETEITHMSIALKLIYWKTFIRSINFPILIVCNKYPHFLLLFAFSVLLHMIRWRQ